jgi:23S rRNA (uracil1939-C5)-methyltransferase
MEFAFGGLKDGPVLLGLRRKGRWDRVEDLSECRLLSPEAGPLLAAVRRWAEERRVPTYHLKSHKGFLRYLVVREGKRTGQRMLNLVTAAGDWPREELLRALEGSGVAVDTVIHSVNAGLSDVARGTETTVLKGEGAIFETLNGLSFRLSPTTFFQTNTLGAEVLYGVVKGFIGSGTRTLMDVYCGSGSIGLFCADRVEKVVGVELNPEAVNDARANARLQSVANAEFVAGDAAQFVADPAWGPLWRSPDTVAVFDPPRPGLGPAVRHFLTENPVSRWIYVSCNPAALTQDLALLASVYAVEAIQAVDLFPHTPHVETAVLLNRK